MKTNTIILTASRVLHISILISALLYAGQSNKEFAPIRENVYAKADDEIIEISEEKTYCTATKDGNFADDRVLIVLNKENSLKIYADKKFKTYKTEDFSEIDCSNVEELTQLSSNAVLDKINKKEYGDDGNDTKSNNASENIENEIDVDTYKRIISLKLNKKGKDNVLKAIKLLEKRNDILSAEPDYYDALFSTTPNEYDYLSSFQRWGIDKINLPNAWDHSTGSNSVYVGVLDSGIESSHTDLSSRIESDLCRKFTSGSTQLDPSPTDEEGHGTKVAGVIGACGNNYSGTSTMTTGVCWNVKLVSLKVRDELNDRAAVSDVTRALSYATSSFSSNKKIEIINYSGGGSSEFNNDNVRKTAISNYPGLFVCAAGNGGTNNDQIPVYPANHRLKNLISVGASDDADGRASFSNYGVNSVDIFAPGDWIFSTSAGNTNGFVSGTSIASPFVAGVAALLLSRCPTMNAQGLKANILDSSDKITLFQDKCSSGGRLNAANEPRILSTNIVSKSGSNWNIQVTNPSYSPIEVVYNSKKCNAGDAQNWTGLVNIDTSDDDVPSGGTTNITISENWFANCIALSHIFNNERVITYADGLSTNGTLNMYTSFKPYQYYGNRDVMGIVGKNGNKWIIKVHNTHYWDSTFQYSKNMCSLNNAQNWTNLTIGAGYMVSGETRNLEIQVNSTLNCVAFSFLPNTGNLRYITVAENLNPGSGEMNLHTYTIWAN